MLRRIPKTVWLILAVSLAIIVPFCLFEAQITSAFNALTASHQARFVVASVLFLALALDIFLPVPSSLASTLCGITLGFVGGFFLSFMAMNISCLLGFLLGRSCANRARRLIGEREARLLEGFFSRHSITLLVALRAVPVLAEASVLFAGLTRMPPFKTALLLLAANAAVSLPYAAVGHLGKTTDSMLLPFLSSLAISGGIFLLSFMLKRHEARHTL